MKRTFVHPTAIIEENVEIGEGTEVGPFTIVHSGVRIGVNSVIGSHCEIGLLASQNEASELIIGAGATIRSHSVIYLGSHIGPGLRTGHHITIRERTIIGTDFQLGSRGDIQGNCTVGDYVRTHADVHIGQGSELGNFIWIFPNVILTNDPDPPSNQVKGVRVRDYAVIAASSLLMPGVVIGMYSVVAAGSLVKHDVPDGFLVSGNPAKIMCKASMLRMHSNPSQRAYPWIGRFHRGYPEEIVREWVSSTKSLENPSLPVNPTR